MSTLIQLPEGSVCWPVGALSSAAQDVRHARTQVHRQRGGATTAAVGRARSAAAHCCAR